jgi:hypothetical protein
MFFDEFLAIVDEDEHGCFWGWFPSVVTLAKHEATNGRHLPVSWS